MQAIGARREGAELCRAPLVPPVRRSQGSRLAGLLSTGRPSSVEMHVVITHKGTQGCSFAHVTDDNDISWCHPTDVGPRLSLSW